MIIIEDERMLKVAMQPVLMGNILTVNFGASSTTDCCDSRSTLVGVTILHPQSAVDADDHSVTMATGLHLLTMTTAMRLLTHSTVTAGAQLTQSIGVHALCQIMMAAAH